MAETNPFDDIAENGVKSSNPFDLLGGDLATPTSTGGAFSRGVVRGVAPAIGGIAGATAGAEGGAAIGALPIFSLPTAGLSIPIGGVVGGLAGAFAGSAAVSGAQHYGLSKLPDKWTEAIGMDDRQERLDEAQHPIASFLGGVAPYAVTMNPMNAARGALPANATAMQRIMANPKTARVFGGAAMGGLELGQEAIGSDPIDWRKVAISTGMGVVFNRPNVIGQRIGEIGGRPTRRLLGLPSPEEAAVAPSAVTATPAEPAAAIAPEAAPASARGIAADLFLHPTVAQAGDTRVMGPGVTEEVFHGTHEMNPAARESTQADARTEQAVIGEPPVPNLRSVARRMTPDLFTEYEALTGQRDDFRAWLDGVDPADAAVRGHLAAVEAKIAELEPQVAAAHRRAAEATGQPPIPAPAAEQPATAEQKRYIADDVARQLIAAGRPREEADAAGQLVAARYEARAAMFRGSRGTAQELYDREAAEILRPGQKSTQYVNRGPRKVNEPALSLFQFLAHRGGLAPHSDLAHTLGENPFLPGFGRLIRKGGMTLDRAREAAVEAGYLHDQGAIEGRESESSINQLLEAIDHEARGSKVYREGHIPKAEDVVFDEMHPEDREAVLRGEEPGSHLMTAEDERAAEEMFQRKRAGEGPNLFAEREAEGQQGLPGTERITQGELAQRMADEKLKAKVAQKPLDVGLFGDDAAQKELFQREQAPPFYSAVARAVDNFKQDRASPEQWLATIKNASGIKAEELEWLGLGDWLKGQKGPVTKQQIADYVRANSVEVREVQHQTASPEALKAYDEAAIDFDAYSKELAEKYDLNPLQNLAMYGRIKNMERAEVEKYEQLQSAYNRTKEATKQGATKFASYQLPGGENYRELLLTLPDQGGSRLADLEVKVNAGDATLAERQEYHALVDRGKQYFRGSHWDEPNVLAHIRFNDRVIDGKKTLFIEEVQSDWHQKGRRSGYKTGEEGLPEGARVYQPDPVNYPNAWQMRIGDNEVPSPRFHAENAEEAQRVAAQNWARTSAAVPDAPFKTSWPELSLKRMIRYAAEHGYEQVAWTPGKVQADRYDLSQHIKEIEYVKNSDGTYRLGIADKDGEPIRSLPNIDVNRMTLPQIEETVGKEIAQKIEGGEGRKYRGHDGFTLENVDLKVGGEGMAAFYDKMLPAAANKLVKKYGAKVGRLEEPLLPMTGAPESAMVNVHTLPITDSLRDAATSEGFPLFQAARGKIRPAEGLTAISRGAGFSRPVITLMKDANASTFIHETGHEWLEQMMRDAAHEAAPDQLRQDGQAVLKWLGVTKSQEIGRRQHEKFARGFEQYVREGIAPSAGLANVFARFKTWLTQIYQTIKGLGAPISDDIRKVFDRMLVAEDHGAVVVPEEPVRPTLADIHEADAREAGPHDADAWADRVAAEGDRAHTADPESANDYEAWLAAKAEHEASGAEPGAGAEPPPAEAGSGGGEGGELHGVRSGPEHVTEGGGVGEPSRPERAGGTDAAGQGAGVPERGTGTGNGSERGDVPLASNPATRFESGDDRVTDLAGNIRVDNLTSVEDIAQAIHDSADRNAEFAGVRGSMTKGQMMDLADAMGLDADKINESRLAQLLGGTANLAPRILAARKLVVQSAELVADAMKKAATGSDEDVAHLAMVIARHDMIQGVLAGATAEWGRAGSAFHSLMSGWGTAEAVGDFLKANTGRTLFQLKQIAKLGTQLDTPGKVSKYLRDAQHRSFGGMILEYWINGLISGPATHTTYMIGNAILAAEKAGPETAAAALIGSLRKAMGRQGDTVRLGEVGAQFRAAARNLPGAVEAGLEGFRSGMTTLLPGETARPLIPFSGDTSLVTARGATNAPVSWADVGAQMFANVRSVRDGLMGGAALIAAGGHAGAPLMGWHWSPLGQIPDIAIRGVPAIPLGTVLRGPGRFIAAIHSFFRMTNYSMEKARLAYRTASNEGLTGTAFDARVGDIWQNPTTEMMEQAVKEATNLTLMGHGGAIVKALSQLTNAKISLPVIGEFAPLKFVDPFVHIGANVINQSIVHRSPVGLLSKEIRADLMGHNGTIAQDTAQARMLVGTMLSVAFGGLAAQGLASGSGPKDPKESAMWRLAGNQAHSVRVGDMWIDVHRLGPMGMLMGIAADMYDVAHQANEGEYVEAAAHLHHAIVQNVLDESFMRGPAELIRAVEDPGRYGDSYIRNMLASFVPFSVGMAQVARASDPYSRQARTVVDAMIAKVPGYSENLLPRRDIWGEPMASRQTIGPQGTLALWTQKVSTDPVNLALYDLGVFPGQVPRKIRNVDLTDQEFDDFARVAGRMTKMRLDTIVRSPDWRTWPNHAKATVVQEVIRQSRETARGVIMARYPHIPRDATSAKLEALND